MAFLATGSLAGIEGFASNEDQKTFSRIEKQLKKCFVIGTHVSENAIIQDFTRQSYPQSIIKRVIDFCVRRGDLQYRMQRKLLYRVK